MTYKKANEIEQILDEMYHATWGMKNWYIYGGVARGGQPRLWQHRFRQLTNGAAYAHIEYKGTNYYGWQKQVGFISVQSKIEEVLSEISPKAKRNEVLKVAFFGTKDYDRMFFSELSREKGEGTYNVDIKYFNSAPLCRLQQC